MTDDDFPRLVLRMALIIKNKSQWVTKDGAGFFKCYAMFPRVGNCFPSVPFETIAHKMPQTKSDGLVKKVHQTVIPAKAGIQNYLKTLDSGSGPE